MTFADLRLAEPILRALASEGYATPTPIQTRAIPPALAGRDILGCARTGTGKTAAFAIPILQRLAEQDPSDGAGPQTSKRGPRAPRALVLCPTRELASQIAESFNAYGRHLPLRHTVIFGGVRQTGQVRALRGGIDVLVATPGRLLDLISQGHVDLRSIRTLVLDEADRMLDMGFIRDIQRIVERLPAKRQTLLFSATMPAEIRRLADDLLHDPAVVQTAPVASTAEKIAQSVHHVERQGKAPLLAKLLREESMRRTLVFTRTKHGADRLVRVLRKFGLEAGAIHGGKTQGARTKALDGFKTGRMPVLVATDIASRGIDVDEVTHVVNYDVPNIPETYVHRIGRTARAGTAGIALSFCDREELADLRAIERLIGERITVASGAPGPEAPAPGNATRQKQAGTGTAGRGSRRARGGSRGGRARRPAAASSTGDRSRTGSPHALRGA